MLRPLLTSIKWHRDILNNTPGRTTNKPIRCILSLSRALSLFQREPGWDAAEPGERQSAANSTGPAACHFYISLISCFLFLSPT